MIKKFQRTRNEKVISGVCGGLGNYFDIDPIIFRFAFIALLLAGGSSIFIYIILVIVIPKEPYVVQSQGTANSSAFDNFQQEDLAGKESDNSNRTVFGLLLISGGALMLLYNIMPYFKLEKLWPVILVIMGLGLLFQKKNTNTNQTNNN